MSTTNPMVQFKFGEYSGFKGLSQYDAGTLYVTTDEQGLYFAKDANTAIKLGNIITYNSLKDWNENTKPPYNADVFYYITDTNALLKYNGTKFVQLNKDYGSDVSSILTAIGATTDTVEAGKTSLWAKINEAKATADAASTAASTADSKAQAARNVANSALDKANANGASINTINSNINTINGNIEALQGIVVTGDNSNDKLRAAITENGTAITTAQNKANSAYSLAETADGKADKNAGDITNINNAIGNDDTTGTLKGRIKANETAISNINTAIGNDNTADSIKGRIKANESAIAEHGTAITNITNNYATKAYAEREADAAETAAKEYADTEIGKAKTDLIGTEVTGVTNTIKGVKKYADEQIGIVATSVTTLSNQIGNLSNIMNFRGTFESTDEVTNPVNGDVIIVNGVEHVYVKETTEATGRWEEFGAASANAARFEAIEERVTALDKAGTGEIALIKGRLDSAESRLTDTEGVANGAATGVNTLNGKVDTLEKTTIPGIEAKIGTVAAGENLAGLIAAEESRAKGVEGNLQTAINTINNTTVPAIETAHNNLAARVTALDEATTGRVAVVEADVSTLKTKTGIANLTGNDTLYSLITAEKARAEAEEADIRANFAAEDVIIRTEINAMLTWGSF